MLVIQRPTVDAIDEAEGTSASPLVRWSLASATPSATPSSHLLSSIPGAAVTQVRFDDALHEFDTTTGVAQDVTDIILNLKDLVLVATATSRSPCASMRGPADVTAADIQPHPTSRCSTAISPLPTSTGRVACIDLTVQNGRGYVSADNSTSSTIGVGPDRLDLLARASGVVRGRADSLSSRTPTVSCSKSRPTDQSAPARRSPGWRHASCTRPARRRDER